MILLSLHLEERVVPSMCGFRVVLRGLLLFLPIGLHGLGLLFSWLSMLPQWGAQAHQVLH